MFPVSASMLKDLADYDASLEAFSRPLMATGGVLAGRRRPDDRAERHGRWYRYIDMTPQAEALFRFIERTIDTELVEELAFLANYDQTKKAIQEIVDMPDRKIDLFIRCCLQNNGRLCVQKRASHFDFLSDKEVARMEEAVQSAYGTDAPKGNNS